MPRSRLPLRSGRFLLWGAVVLFFSLYGGLAAYHYARIDRPENTSLPELKAASIEAPKLTRHDWPQWRGPQRDGVSRETGLLETWPSNGPPKLWEQLIGPGYSTVIVAKGRAFTMFQDGPNESLACWDASTGKELWRFSYPCDFTNDFGNGPRTTPAIAGETIFLLGSSGMLHALEAFGELPKLLWKKDLKEEFAASIPKWGYSNSPLVEEGRLFFQPGGKNQGSVAALDATTGTLLWKKLDDAAGYSSPMAATLAGRPQIVFFTANRLAGLVPDTGEILWEYPWVTDYECNIATPIILGDDVFISSGYGRGCALLKIEADGNGAKAQLVYKKLKMRNHFSTSVFDRDHFFGFDESNLVCMKFNGDRVWSEAGYKKGSLLLVDGKLIIHSEDGILALVDADPEKFHEIARFTFSDQPGKCWTAPIVADGRLYVRDHQKIACFDLRASK